MSLVAKKYLVAVLSVLFLCALLLAARVEIERQRPDHKSPPIITAENAKCIDCHKQKTPVVVHQWEDSQHAVKGVACVECHQAEEDDVDGFQHEGRRIATIVSPQDCSRCHDKIVEEFTHSHHSKAAQFVGSLDNALGMLAEGPMAAANGCWQCHGSRVKFVTDDRGETVRDDNGKPLLDPATWPNTGVGRVNPDGSRGSCTACHSRHVFSKKMARQPEVCGKCHMGPDHPQIEIFEESKHGIAYRTRIDEMNLESDSWVVGEDYDAAPTCATCHMSATRNQPLTHDVGARISWTLRPVISKKLQNWESKRNDMKDVCAACHAPAFVNNFYKQYDGSIELYNNKFARPAKQLMDLLKSKGLVTASPFDDEIEWSFFRLWHHEGRRARMGVSMQGPDYTQWHGFFEVAERFYFDFVPQVRELGHGDPEVAAAVDKVLASQDHAWLQGMSPEEIEKLQSFYEQRYGAENK